MVFLVAHLDHLWVGKPVWVEDRQVMASSEKSLNKLVAQWGNSLRVHWWQLITVAGGQPFVYHVMLMTIDD